MSITTPTIIVADDEPLVQQTLLRLLQSAGYEVVLAENGDELVHSALAKPPALILTDTHMPIMDGPEAVRQLRADHRTVNTPIVMMSARPEVAALALDAGADCFLCKPFKLDEVLQIVAQRSAAPLIAAPALGPTFIDSPFVRSLASHSVEL